MKKVPARLIVNFTERDHHRPQRSMDRGLKAFRKPGESKLTPLLMDDSFPSWLRSNSFAYDLVPAVLSVGHNDQTRRYPRDVI
jgi:hypothetical protein